MKVTAVIIARGGSQRLPGKNLLMFDGLPLVAHKVRQLFDCKHVDDVVVGSDDPDILDAASDAGAMAVQRQAEYCDEKTRSWNEVIFDMVSRVNGEVILWAHCTNPCIRPSTYERALLQYKRMVWDGGEGDSLISVTAVQNHIWWCGKPLNFNPWVPPHVAARDVYPAYVQNGGIFIASRELMLKCSYVYGRDPILFPVDADEATDIDTLADFEQAVRVYTKGE